VTDGKVCTGPETDALPFLAEFMRAYLEAYRLTFETALSALAPERRGATAAVDRKALVEEALEQGRAAFLSGQVQLRESLSKATIENAAEWLVTQGIIAEQGGKLSLADGTGAELRRIVDGITPQFAV
jgi:glycerol-3-phosphate O-acyltransferase